jgi:SAM-dependent methyltransferase
LATVDNTQFSEHTVWTGAVAGQFRYHQRKSSGQQFICDGTSLTPIKSGNYDCFLASHCLEHIANPLRALAEWRRILTTGGLGLILLPHKEVTFDWRRPVTPLAHMVADLQRGVEEDDSTHFEEIMSLHDLSKTPEYRDLDAFRARCFANHTQRAMHQHVFITQSAIELVDCAGFQALQVDAIRPDHIALLIQKSAVPDNSAFLSPSAGWRLRSPFAADRP